MVLHKCEPWRPKHLERGFNFLISSFLCSVGHGVSHVADAALLIIIYSLCLYVVLNVRSVLTLSYATTRFSHRYDLPLHRYHVPLALAQDRASSQLAISVVLTQMSSQWRQARDDRSSASNQYRSIPSQWSGWSGKSWNTNDERTGHTWTTVRADAPRRVYIPPDTPGYEKTDLYNALMTATKEPPGCGKLATTPQMTPEDLTCGSGHRGQKHAVLGDHNHRSLRAENKLRKAMTLHLTLRMKSHNDGTC